jgi:hypothetical protein
MSDARVESVRALAASVDSLFASVRELQDLQLETARTALDFIVEQKERRMGYIAPPPPRPGKTSPSGDSRREAQSRSSFGKTAFFVAVALIWLVIALSSVVLGLGSNLFSLQIIALASLSLALLVFIVMMFTLQTKRLITEQKVFYCVAHDLRLLDNAMHCSKCETERIEALKLAQSQENAEESVSDVRERPALFIEIEESLLKS